MAARWVWIGSAVLVVGLVVVSVPLGLDRAQQLAAVVAAAVAVLALALGAVRAGADRADRAPSSSLRAGRIRVRRTGRIRRPGAMVANTGVDAPAETAAHLVIRVSDTGDIDGAGQANTGLRLR